MDGNVVGLTSILNRGQFVEALALLHLVQERLPAGIGH